MLPRRVEYRASLGGRGRERLFAQNVLARRGRTDRPYGVEVVRQRDVDRVDVEVVPEAPHSSRARMQRRCRARKTPRDPRRGWPPRRQGSFAKAAPLPRKARDLGRPEDANAQGTIGRQARSGSVYLTDVLLGEKFGRDRRRLGAVHQAIEDGHGVVERIVTKKRELDPDETDTNGAAEEAGEAPGGRRPGGGPVTLEPTDRGDALRQLAEVAAFFRRTEPHSPVIIPGPTSVQVGAHAAGELAPGRDQGRRVLGNLRDTLG